MLRTYSVNQIRSFVMRNSYSLNSHKCTLLCYVMLEFNLPVEIQRQFPKPPALVSARRRFVPQYFGESSAFSIQLFCIDERYETRLSVMLIASYLFILRFSLRTYIYTYIHNIHNSSLVFCCAAGFWDHSTVSPSHPVFCCLHCHHHLSDHATSVIFFFLLAYPSFFLHDSQNVTHITFNICLFYIHT